MSKENQDHLDQNNESEIDETQDEEALLSDTEARILGALMEKQLTTPDAYPLTLNSLVLACNQKSSREPQTQFSGGEVAHCINQLRDRSLIEVDYGSRADRYDQRLTRELALRKDVQAILNVMMLRGPQTLNELMTRTSRMHTFKDMAELEECVEHQTLKTKPIIKMLEKLSGQREVRYAHTLCGKPKNIKTQDPVARSAPNNNTDELLSRIAVLEEKVARLLKHCEID